MWLADALALANDNQIFCFKIVTLSHSSFVGVDFISRKFNILYGVLYGPQTVNLKKRRRPIWKQKFVFWFCLK